MRLEKQLDQTETTSSKDTLERYRKHRDRRGFPDMEDARFRDSLLFPYVEQSFKIPAGSSIFTVGSCFARNIEEELGKRGFNVPTLRFTVPPTEWPHRPNGLLNEYNPGAIYQRIAHAVNQQAYPAETLVEVGDVIADLLLPGGAGVSLERAVTRRAEISEIYGDLIQSNIAIITLGFIEAWYDQETGYFLNRMPPVPCLNKHPERFVFKRLGFSECLELLDRAIVLLGKIGMRILLTVSPVPIGNTFSGQDCVIANEQSKSILRICAGNLAQSYDYVDYFPSYEIARSGGLSAYSNDNIHVKPETVQKIVHYMLSLYM